LCASIKSFSTILNFLSIVKLFISEFKDIPLSFLAFQILLFNSTISSVFILTFLILEALGKFSK
jgi:hypothetical protein